MSVEFPLDAFDDTHVIVRRKVRPRVDRAKLTSAAITTLIHLVVGLSALTAVRGPDVEPQKILTVQITLQKQRPLKEMPPTPQLQRPMVIASIMPDVAIQNPAPTIAAQPVVPGTVAQEPVTASPKVVGESRESYFNRLLAQLNRYKQYPRAARTARMEGIVMLHFMMDAQGRVLSFEIAKSSGRPVLDAEALALIQRAQPLPPLPADYPTRTLDAIVPIEFFLNR